MNNKLWAVLVYAVFVAYLSLRPMDSSAVGNWDKLGHLLLYMGFTLVGIWAYAKPRSLLLICVLVIGYGAAMEFAQSFVPGRMMSFGNVIANSSGVLVAVGIVKVLALVSPSKS